MYLWGIPLNLTGMYMAQVDDIRVVTLEKRKVLPGFGQTTPVVRAVITELTVVVQSINKSRNYTRIGRRPCLLVRATGIEPACHGH